MKVSLRRAQPIVRKLVVVTLENISELVSTDYTHTVGDVRRTRQGDVWPALAGRILTATIWVKQILS